MQQQCQQMPLTQDSATQMVPQINMSTQCINPSSSSSLSLSLMRFPFTATQWQELEHQALVFKYMVSGMPIPPDLLFPIKTSLDSSLSSNFLLHQPQHIAGWNGFQIGFGKKIDPEPGRCRRTDGKKWRCSKEAFPDSKYCERHMHRGRNRSRKPVEILSPPQQPSSLKSAAAPSESHFLYPHFPSSRESPNFFLEPNLYSKPQSRDCSRRTEGEINEVAFFPAGSDSYSSSVKPKSYSSDLGEKIETFDDSNCRQYQHQHDYRFYSRDAADEQPKKVMHHFLDEWAPNESKSEEKMPSHRTQLSISVPNSLHDFFVTQK